VLREVRESRVVLLPCDPASVAVARRRITADLVAAGVFDTAIGDAALVMSELLSNAILHARPLHGRWLQVAWTMDAGSVEIAVSDGGGPTLPHAELPSLSAIGGRGLGIVDHLSDRWGVRADSPGTTVWAVLPASCPERAGRRLLARDRAILAAGTARSDRLLPPMTS
jgi:anti-sigma regulatory factor (Ser/Thr protein kinase)